MSTENRKPCEVRTILDREISSPEQDAFGHKHFADILHDLIGSHPPPFSIGLLGHWGTGKSSIKALYLKGLNDGRDRSRRVKPITFNAWRHGGDGDLKRALLRQVYLDLGGDQQLLTKELSQQVEEASSHTIPFTTWGKIAIASLAPPAFLLALVFVVFLFPAILFVKYAPFTLFWNSATLIAGLGAAGISVKPLASLASRAPSFLRPITTVSFPSQTAEEYEDLLLNQLRCFKRGVGKDVERIVVFVDDLDRLSSPEMVEGLDAVRTFLEIPKDNLPDGIGLVFVISCDEDRVADALARGRGRLQTDLPGTVITRADARRYLDRLFQFRLEIPPMPKLDMRRFAKARLEAELVELRDSLRDHGADADAVLDRLIHVGVKSPRNAVQLLNAFAQSWAIATVREHQGRGSDDGGLLHEGAITQHPLALAVVCVLRVDFPDLYGEIVDRPQFLNEIVALVAGTPQSDLPLPSHFHLRKFLQDTRTEDDPVAFEDRHRPLRTYLSSLRSLRMPKRIEPFLLLAEDALTRRYGSDKAAEVFQSFVSGDTRGVLEAFGLELGNRPMSESDARILADMAEEVERDSDDRQANAAQVLADLADRVPSNYTRQLLTPLARQLGGKPDVRMLIGPLRTRSLLTHFDSEDRRLVAAAFTDDLLSPEPREFLLPTGGKPDLDELSAIVGQACELVLEVRREHGLPHKADTSLLEWLKLRNVGSGESSQTLPITALEGWMDQHEDHLIPSLNAQYVDLVLPEFERSSLDTDRPLKRIQRVHDSLAAAGQDERETLWQQLTRLVQIGVVPVADAACSSASKLHRSASERLASSFLSALCESISDALAAEDDVLRITHDSAARCLIKLLGEWHGRLPESDLASTTKLIVQWSRTEERAGYAADAFEVLQVNKPDALQTVLDNWANQPIGSLDERCAELVAKNALELLDEPQFQNFVNQLDEAVEQQTAVTDQAQIYRIVVGAMPNSAWNKEPLQEHLGNLIDQLIAHPANQGDYLDEYFPTALMLMRHASSEQRTKLLDGLFPKAQRAPNAFAFLHTEMTGSWRRVTEDLPDPSVTNNLLGAIEFIVQDPLRDAAVPVVRSVVSAFEADLLTDELAKQLAAACVSVWPHHPDAVVELPDGILKHTDPVSFQQLVEKQPTDGEQMGQLAGNLVSTWSPEEVRAAIDVVLSTQPFKRKSETDAGLSVLCDAISEPRDILLPVIRDNANDGQQLRVLEQAMRDPSRFGLEFFREAVIHVLPRHKSPKSRKLLIDQQATINALAKTAEDRASLAAVLIGILNPVSPDERVTVSKWVNDLGGRSQLENQLAILDTLPPDQVQAVIHEMKPSKPLDKYLKRRLEEATRASSS